MANVAQRSFAAGELSPTLYSRTDLEKYIAGLRTCRNFQVLRQGGAANRPGTMYCGTLKNSGATVGRLIPFVFSLALGQTYVFELGDFYLRIWQNLGTSGVATLLTVSGLPAWSNVANYNVGDLVAYLGVNYYAKTANTNAQPNLSAAWVAMPGNILEIPTPWHAADLAFLNYAQQADVMTLVHPSYVPMQLARKGATDWPLQPAVFAPNQPAPTGLVLTGGNGAPWDATKAYVYGDTASSGGVNYTCILANTNQAPPNATYWKVSPALEFVVTALDPITLEESSPSTPLSRSGQGSQASPFHLAWTAIPGVTQYNVYRTSNAPTSGNIHGFIGVALSNAFDDTGITADNSNRPPVPGNPFISNNNPGVVGTYQQRQVYANTNTQPETVFMSRSALRENFSVSNPSEDDDAVIFTLVGKQVNEVRHLLDVGRLMIFTAGGEWLAQGDTDGVITPTAINLRQGAYVGSARQLVPTMVGNRILYVQARGNVVRELHFDAIQGLLGADLSLMSAHLLDPYTLLEWGYAQTPETTIWMIRSDGVLLGLTYQYEQQVVSWHRHDTGAGDAFENLCIVPEGTEDGVYVIVRRTVNGATVRYLERLHSRQFTDVRDAHFVDAGVVIDGRNTSGETMTLSGGVNWTFDELLTLTRSVGGFTAGDASNGTVIQLTGSDGTVIRFTITGYSSGTVVTGHANKTVPVTMRSVAITAWAKAIQKVTGLNHLIGRSVNVLADGFVASSPNNSTQAFSYTVDNTGSITLDRPYGVIRVGLPIIADLETLDIDTPAGASIKDRKLITNRVGLFVQNTRGLFVGTRPPGTGPAVPPSTDPLDGLFDARARSPYDSYDQPPALVTDVLEVNAASTWNRNGRVFIRQVDPLPATVLAILPQGYLPSDQPQAA